MKLIDDFLGKVACLTGYHNWSNWDYSSSTSCWQIKKCERCTKQDGRWAVHQWGTPEYISSNSCKKAKLCQRCKEQENNATLIEHIWDEWGEWKENAIDNFHCRQRTRTCQRCKKQETEWGPHAWVKEEEGFLLTCSQCGKISLGTQTQPSSFSGQPGFKSSYDKDEF